MKTNRTTILLAAALVAAVLPILPSAAAEDEVAPLPPACEAALSATRDRLIAQQGVIAMPEAVALLQSNAGEVCGFDVYAGDVGGIDQRALGNFLNIATPQQIKIDGGGGGGGLDVTKLLGRANLERCEVAGGGTGSIVGYVLNIPVETVVAVGEWAPVTGNLVEVNGEGGNLGGTQTGETGVMRIAGVPIPATQEDSTAVCAKTGVQTKEKCWNFGIYRSCETTTTVVFSLCGATAKQSLEGFVRLVHDYTVEDAPDAC